MIVDILMAFVIVLIIKMLSLHNKYFKQIIVFVCCLTVSLIYFVNGCQIDFIGEIDLAIWIMFVIMFDIVLTFVAKKIMKHIDKIKSNEET